LLQTVPRVEPVTVPRPAWEIGARLGPGGAVIELQPSTGGADTGGAAARLRKGPPADAGSLWRWLIVGVLATAIGATIGVATGLLSGYLGGWVDSVIMRFYDALLAFPGIIIGIGVISVLGPSSINVAYALALGGMPFFARLMRSTVLSEREREYVFAARSIGAAGGRIMVRHVLPNTLPPLLVQLSLAMGFAVLAEASLSFLGLGTQPPDPSWGSMLNDRWSTALTTRPKYRLRMAPSSSGRATRW